MSVSSWKELALRFLLGGATVTAFALLGEIFKPKTFAGIFGAAPSVALTTLGLAFLMHGPSFARIESKSMILGAIAFVGYSVASSAMIARRRMPVWIEAGLNWFVWFAIALGGWWVLSMTRGA